MGSADLVPGVSGGTMALILGIYTRLLEAIRSFDRTWLLCILRADLSCIVRRPHFGFLIPLLAGIAAALVFFTRVVPLPVLIRTHPEPVYGLFFGLILASIVVLMREIEHYRTVDILLTAAGTLLGLLIVNLVPMETPEGAWFMFLAGALAICAMILPGISGSFILLMLRKYSYVIGAVGELNFTVLLPFALGCVAGLVVFTRFLVWLLHHYYKRTLLVIKGILIGSLWAIWPFQERVYTVIHGKEKLLSSTPLWPPGMDTSVAGSIGLMATGFVLVLVLYAWSDRNRV